MCGVMVIAVETTKNYAPLFILLVKVSSYLVQIIIAGIPVPEICESLNQTHLSNTELK